MKLEHSLGARGDVDVVVPNGDVRHDAETRSGVEEPVIDPIVEPPERPTVESTPATDDTAPDSMFETSPSSTAPAVDTVASPT